MNCREARQLMGKPDQEALAAHVADCARCRELWQQRTEAGRALAAVRSLDPEPPEGLSERVKAAVARETAPQQALTTLRHAEVPVPADLAVRIKRAAAASQAQTRHLPWVVGTPAFVATVASLLLAAVSVYMVGGQWLPNRYEALLENHTVATVRAATNAVQPMTAVPSPVKVPPAVKPAAPVAVLAAVVPARAPATSARPASVPRAKAVASVPVRERAGGRAENVGAPAPHSDPARALPEATVEEPVVPAAPAVAPATDADRGLVAGLVARYVVERYVAERIIQSEPTLLAVTTSVPTAPNTALSGISP